MKSYFIRLFNYDLFANRQINELLQARPDEQAIHLMSHLLSAASIWLLRCKRINTAGVNVWPDAEIAQLTKRIESIHEEWISFLEDVNETDFDQTISYQNSAGAQFNNVMCDIMGHVINHGTHTRAQIGQLLKRSGADKLPVTDYSFYLRQLNH